MFQTFDGPSGETCIARRDRSDSPLQALTLLNDPMLVEIEINPVFAGATGTTIVDALIHVSP